MLMCNLMRGSGIVFADDLTGSNEIALVLAENGLGDAAKMLEGIDALPQDQTVALNLDTRDLPVEEAQRRIVALLKDRPDIGERLVFKKVDSTARRHLSVELDACLKYAPFDAAVVALAAPNDDRYTLNGIHHAVGQPIDQTPYKVDLACPTAHLPTLLTHGTDLKCASVVLKHIRNGVEATVDAIDSLMAEGNRVLAMDCVTKDDLRIISSAIVQSRQRILPIGSAAMFRQMVSVTQAAESAVGARPVLVVCGSLNPRSRTQVERLLDFSDLAAVTMETEGDPSVTIQTIAGHLFAGRGVVVMTPDEPGPGTGGDTVGRHLAQQMGIIVKGALTSVPVCGVVAMGGAIAAEIIREIGGTGLKVRDRLSSVVPVLELTGGPFEGLRLITKGGGVGADDVLIDATSKLQRNGSSKTTFHSVQVYTKESPIMATRPETLPIIALTIGDPAGIGPEISVKSVTDPTIFDECRPLVIGDADIVRAACAFSGIDAEIHTTTSPDGGVYKPGVIDVLDLGAMNGHAPVYGKVSKEAGAAALAYIDRSIDLALEKSIHGVATAPIHKEAIHLAGCPHPGHTDIYGIRTGSTNYTSMLAVGAFRVLHATLHCSLADVATQLTYDRVLEITRLAHSAVRDLGVENPRVAVAGLNPHSSDGGLFGDHEEKIIIPAIKAARAEGIDAYGPIPSDSMFMRLRGGAWDVAVAMYHDQGHIPTKMMGWFWDESKQTWTDLSGIGVTVGLPIIRTNPDHGTAFEIAGKGIANPQAMRESVQVAAQMAKGRGLI